MFGSPVAFTVPDLDRTDHLVIIGANPLVSNGSLATAADFPGKLKALRKRGGRLTVIDPARTRTAELADRHIAPRPGTDAALLFAVVHVLFDEGLVDLWWRGRARRRRRAKSASWQTTSRRRPSPPTAASPPTRSAPSPARSPPRRRRRSTAGSAPPQSNSAPSAAGWSTSSTSSPATSTGPAGRCSRCRPSLRRRARRGPAAGFAHRALAQPGLRAPRGAVRTARRRARRGDRHPRRRADQGAGHHRGKPGAVRARRRSARPRAGRRRLHGQRRPVPQRDDAPRRRHPAAAAAVAERALRLRAQRTLACATTPATRRRRCRWRTAVPTSPRSCPGSR